MACTAWQEIKIILSKIRIIIHGKFPIEFELIMHIQTQALNQFK